MMKAHHSGAGAIFVTNDDGHRHPEAADRVTFEVEFDPHDRLLAYHPTIMPRFDPTSSRTRPTLHHPSGDVTS